MTRRRRGEQACQSREDHFGLYLALLCHGVISNLAKVWSLFLPSPTGRQEGLPATSAGIDGISGKYSVVPSSGVILEGVTGLETLTFSAERELMGLRVMEKKNVSESFSSGPLKEITVRLVIQRQICKTRRALSPRLGSLPEFFPSLSV